MEAHTRLGGRVGRSGSRGTCRRVVGAGVVAISVAFAIVGFLDVVLGEVGVLEAQVEVELLAAALKHVVEPPVQHGRVPVRVAAEVDAEGARRRAGAAAAAAEEEEGVRCTLEQG